ncbi:methionine synthase [Oxobacter pfennigii]|uniref:Methionine synthase n=1 Tax=Oxobacter pfennigii TaxID=36849 RepID=A0A0P8W1U8_9CLOT|nr:cobalamin-dependent protein [Oxobacter pfennigii]KPU42489.1 methionine synthase [Oxobacter pfennigii]
MSEKLTNAMAELDEDLVFSTVKELQESGTPALEIIAALQKGMDIIGERFEAKDYFLSELILSGDVFSSAVALLGDSFSADTPKLGTVVMGTVKDDIHNIGKDIVVSLLSCNGFKVVDVGIDAPAEKFIEAINRHNPQVIGMSCLLTSCFDSMKNIIEEIDKAGLREGRKILIGGGTITGTVSEYVKADAYTNSAQQAVPLCKKLMNIA